MPIPKFTGSLIEKRTLAKNIYYLIYQTDSQELYAPGQFLNLKLKEGLMRAYSIVSFENKKVSFLINTKPAGLASQYFDEAKIGDSVSFIGPLGRFAYQKTPKTKNFIATSTGVAPFVPMIKEILKNQKDTKVNLFFGARTKKEYFLEKVSEYKDFLKNPNFNFYICLSRGRTSKNPNFYNSRITDVLKNLLEKQNLTKQEFYLCGNEKMVLDIKNILLENQCENIHLESFGK